MVERNVQRGNEGRNGRRDGGERNKAISVEISMEKGEIR